MHPVFVPAGHGAAVPIRFVSTATWEAARGNLDPAARSFAEASGFAARAGEHLLLPAADGSLAAVLFGIDAPLASAPDRFMAGKLAGVLPTGIYRFADAPEPRFSALAFAFGHYRFDRYKKRDDKDLRLQVPDGVDAAALSRTVEAVTLVRDLVNTPANDMGPAALEQAARDLAARHGATLRVIVGDELLAQNFPLIHAVGRAAGEAPRLIDLTWGDLAHPKVTLVGKGVCFDSGGLDIKPDSAMLLMKKDMGGAATALALAHMVMDRRLPVRLRVLIPAVENAISGNAFRPRDIYPSRKGLTVEIGNTDAEGRLVLADALALADEEAPDLLIDMGTLTGAARVALGPEVPPFYTHDDGLAADLAHYADAENDPLWRLPLWRPYDAMLDSKVADLGNVGSGGFAGSIVCALFLNRFVSAAKAWLHLDIYAWNPSAKPARPEGGECQAARALDALLAARYGAP
ncbi:leucyl aminopeptidase family protein [Xanthobacteraceae bacterium Astr-EGSB]|uniref:leucyl aminopeptidase family protein n=1 Tax=Astrobacterium formosum TaxID=3069710 RepID=UPI0027B1062F|nr:leucyl aminopeptidase family protein [Xanthobacteraceae bacterium Astr-EGSB]